MSPMSPPVNPDWGLQWLRIASASLGIGCLPKVAGTPPDPLKACDEVTVKLDDI